MPRKARIDAPGALHHIHLNPLDAGIVKKLKELDKYAQNVKARSLLCYWETRELSMTTVDLARKLNLAQPTVSQAVMRGQKIAEDQGLCLIEKPNQYTNGRYILFR